MPGRSRSRPPRMVRRRPRSSWHLMLSGGLVLTAVVALLYAQWQDRSRRLSAPEPLSSVPSAPAEDAQALADSLYFLVEPVLEEIGIWPDLIQKSRGEPDRIEIQVPVDLPLPVVNLCLSRFVERSGGSVFRTVETIPDRKVEMSCGLDGAETSLFVFERNRDLHRRTGRIAIVLGDLGKTIQKRDLIERFCALSQPLTFAVPSRGTDTLVDLARRHGHEITFHSPVAEKDLFIDPVDDRRVIESRLWDLADTAARTGRAIGVGRGRENTLLALEAVLPRLERRGFRFVPLSRLYP